MLPEIIIITAILVKLKRLVDFLFKEISVYKKRKE